MDPMALLDFERRTGTSNQDLDEFVKKADAVARAVEQIKNGTFDPKNCDIPGYKTPEQEAAEEKARKKREEERKKREEEKKRQEKLDEKEAWWNRARLRFTVFDDDNDDESRADKAEAWANRIVAAYKSRDANDYSMWDKWEPKDPVTLEEKAQQDALLEKMRNEEFEKANPDFCTQFKEDLEKRQRSTQEKERQAAKFKKQGNVAYKRKQYDAAIKAYMDALLEAPFCPLILTNIAQAYMRLNAFDDAMEFCERALYVKPAHVKALSRKAAILHMRHNFDKAFAVIERAVAADETKNPDLMEQFFQIKVDYEDAHGRADLQKHLEQPHSLETWHLHTMQSLLEKLGDNDADQTPLLRAILPMLQSDHECKLLFRTSGSLLRICARLDDETPVDDDEKRAILECILSVAIDDSCTQHRLFLDVPFRQWIIDAISNNSSSHIDLLLNLLDECMNVKLWKTCIASNMPVLRGLLTMLTGKATADGAANLLFKASELESGRLILTTALVQPALSALLTTLAHPPSTTSLLHTVGLVHNLTNHAVFREIVATEANVPEQMTQRLVALLERRDNIVAKRTLAILLNLSLDASTRLRSDMAAANVHQHVLSWLERSTQGTSVALLSRLVSVLCRLHSLPSREIAAPAFLSALWRVFEQTQDRNEATWQLHAQLMCHFAWSQEVPTTKDFFEEHGCVTAMVKFLHGKRPLVAKEEAAAFERTVTNCTKCWISLLPTTPSTSKAITDNGGLELLVDLMSHMKDEKVARKNVAILLAKLCQRSDDIKERVRALRGIEMMLSICRDLKMQ
ncbi:unnamed protein product [Aphanomyces euteiches]